MTAGTTPSGAGASAVGTATTVAHPFPSTHPIPVHVRDTEWGQGRAVTDFGMGVFSISQKKKTKKGAFVTDLILVELQHQCLIAPSAGTWQN